jgi:2',3'-cyclic-nucleotide 2'-phosphodiesterase (5'-nucleotidase family)
MKHYVLFFTGIFIFVQTHAATMFQHGDLFSNDSEIIGYATSDFYKGTPEGNLGDLVADAILNVAVPDSENSDKISLLAPQSIRGSLKKGEIYFETIQEILPHNDSLFLFKISEKDIHILFDRIAQKGGMPCAGFSFAIENMSAHNILVNNQPINSDKKYFLITSQYTMKVLNLQMASAVIPLNIGIQQALSDFIIRKTKNGKPIFGYKQRRIYYKN